MDYRMLGDILPAVEIRLQAGEAMYTQSGGMAWMSDGFTLDSNVKGGLMKGQYHCVCIHCAGEDIGHRYGKDQPDLPEGSFPVRPANSRNQYRTD